MKIAGMAVVVLAIAKFGKPAAKVTHGLAWEVFGDRIPVHAQEFKERIGLVRQSGGSLG